MALEVDEEFIPLILRYKDVRSAAKDWQTYSSDAPFRVPVPSEEKVRSVRQLPIEIDPPLHKDYRKLLEPHFRKPLQPEYLAKLSALIQTSIGVAIDRGEFDVVREFALPLQSKALALLLGLPIKEADTWIEWGTHVFHEGDGVTKGDQLGAYIQKRLAKACDEPGNDDFFSALTKMQLNGRALSNAEMTGIANLTFAGGRDTIINAISFIVGYFAEHPRQLQHVALDEKRTNLAVEEFVRIISPLTFIGRVCPHGAEIGAAHVVPNGRVGLCWASANYDEAVFDEPEQIKLDRSPNPHVGFGSGHHTCLGAPQARAILRTLIEHLANLSIEISIIKRVPKYEDSFQYRRWMAYENLTACFDRK